VGVGESISTVMGDPETNDLHWRATLWEATGSHDRQGRPIVSDPVEINCRWLESTSEGKAPHSNAISYDAVLLSDREIADESILWEGELCEVPSPATNLYKVVGHKYTPDIKGRATRYRFFLAKYGNTLPEIES